MAENRQIWRIFIEKEKTVTKKEEKKKEILIAVSKDDVKSLKHVAWFLEI